MHCNRSFIIVRRAAFLLFFLSCIVTASLSIRLFPLFPFPYFSPSERINIFRIFVPISLIPATCVILIGYFAHPVVLSERTAILCACFGISPAAAYLFLRLGFNSTLVCYHFFLPALLLTVLAVSYLISDLVKKAPRSHPILEVVVSAVSASAILFLIINRIIPNAAYPPNTPYTAPLYYALIALIIETVILISRLFSHDKGAQICTGAAITLHCLFFQIVFYLNFTLIVNVYLALLLVPVLIRLIRSLLFLKHTKG